MLELMLTRPDERPAWSRRRRGLRFLVLDELHTYRGRQGADVALLVRRVREACRPPRPCSASARPRRCPPAARSPTSSARSPGSRAGSSAPTVAPEHVISETLVRATTDRQPDRSALRRRSRSRARRVRRSRSALPGTTPSLPIRWRRGSRTRSASPRTQESGRLVRRAPDARSADAPRRTSPTLTGDEPRPRVATAIRATLLAGSRTKRPGHRPPAVRLPAAPVPLQGRHGLRHRRAEAARAIDVDYQVELPERPERRLFPLAFCRECGQEYLMARAVEQRRSGLLAGRGNDCGRRRSQ